MPPCSKPACCSGLQIQDAWHIEQLLDLPSGHSLFRNMDIVKAQDVCSQVNRSEATRIDHSFCNNLGCLSIPAVSTFSSALWGSWHSYQWQHTYLSLHLDRQVCSLDERLLLGFVTHAWKHLSRTVCIAPV